MMRSLKRHIVTEVVIFEVFVLYVAEFILSAVFLYFSASSSFSLAENNIFRPMVCVKVLFCSLVVSLSSVALGLYRSDICLRRSKPTVIFLTVTVSFAFLLEFIRNFLASRMNFGSNDCLRLDLVSGWITCVAVTRIALLLAHQSEVFAKKVLVVGSSQSARRIQNVINSSGGRVCQFIGNVVLPAGRNTQPALSAFDITELRRQRIWGVVLAKDTADSVPQESFLAHVLSLKQFRRAYVFDEAGFCEHRLQRLNPDALPQNWQPVLATIIAQSRANLTYRLIDIVISSGLLMLTLPLFALFALAIRIESPGPVFQAQVCLGQHGKRFVLRKFRSLVDPTNSLATPVWAMQTGPKVTKVGRFMRSLHFDGLPQLLNVLFGEMSLIGPRPEPPDVVEALSKLIPHYRDRTCLKPGMTGWAQVKNPCGTTVEDARVSLGYDFFYIKHRSLLLQLMIAVLTLRIILFSKGANLKRYA